MCWSSVFSRGRATRCFKCNPIRNAYFARYRCGVAGMLQPAREGFTAKKCSAGVTSSRGTTITHCKELSSPCCAPLLLLPELSSVSNCVQWHCKQERSYVRLPLMQCYSGLLFVIAPGRQDLAITHNRCCVQRIAVIVQNKD